MHSLMRERHRSQSNLKKHSINSMFRQIKRFESELVLGKPAAHAYEKKLGSLFRDLKSDGSPTSSEASKPPTSEFKTTQDISRTPLKRYTVTALPSDQTKKILRPLSITKKALPPSDPDTPLILARLQQLYTTEKHRPCFSRGLCTQQLTKLKRRPSLINLIDSPPQLNSCGDNGFSLDLREDIRRHQSELFESQSKLKRLSCMKRRPKRNEWSHVSLLC